MRHPDRFLTQHLPFWRRFLANRESGRIHRIKVHFSRSQRNSENRKLRQPKGIEVLISPTKLGQEDREHGTARQLDQPQFVQQFHQNDRKS